MQFLLAAPARNSNPLLHAHRVPLGHDHDKQREEERREEKEEELLALMSVVGV